MSHDEPVHPRSIGEDIDLGTVTPEQLPELRRRAAVAKEEHEHAMARKREEHAAEQQAIREEAARLECRHRRYWHRGDLGGYCIAVVARWPQVPEPHAGRLLRIEKAELI